MNTDTIGAWAGLVWNALNEADVLANKQLQKWLARENKITFEESGDSKEILVALVK